MPLEVVGLGFYLLEQVRVQVVLDALDDDRGDVLLVVFYVFLHFVHAFPELFLEGVFDALDVFVEEGIDFGRFLINFVDERLELIYDIGLDQRHLCLGLLAVGVDALLAGEVFD